GTVCKWRGRFVVHRLDGLYDEPRPGAKRTITDAQVEDVIIRTLETTPRGATHWSTREMAKAVGLSHTAISRMWHTFGLQPHLSDARVPHRLDVHIIMDNYSTHKTALIRNWLAKRPRFHVHFTPTYGSWLNLVERWFAELTMKQIRRGTFRSVPQLKAAIQEFI